jgi:putative protease
VAAVTQVYRRALDAAMAGKTSTSPTPSEWYALEMTFSRGLFSGWMHGVNHQKLVGARYGKKRGALIGRVSVITRDGMELDEFKTAVKPGNGVVIDSGGDTNNEEGGFVYAVRGRELTFARGKVDWDRVRAGNLVWKTSDPALDKALRHTFKGEIPRRPQHSISLTIKGQAGQPMEIQASVSNGPPVSLTSQTPLQPALKHPLTVAVLREQFGRLGGTGFALGEVTSSLPDGLMLPLSELGKLRRKLVEALSQQQQISRRRPAIRGVARRELSEIVDQRSRSFDSAREPQLTVLCRTQEQLESAAATGVSRLYADFEDIRKYPDAVAWVRQNAPEAQLFLATPRIQKSGEQGFFKLIERAEPHGVLVRNLGAIAHFRTAGVPMVGDFSLNVANPLTARFFKAQGLDKLTVSYDLNIEQAVDLLEGCPQDWFELTLHQHMPMFHMEHCVYAAFMSTGSTFLDCGRPCEKHSVTLRDRVGMEHPLRADVGCRNTLFNAVAQTAGRYFGQFMETGLRAYRIELLTENAMATKLLIDTYRSLFNGQTDGDRLWERLKARSQYGVTGGTLRQLEPR